MDPEQWQTVRYSPGIYEGGRLRPTEHHTAVGDGVAVAERVEVGGVALVREGALDVLIRRQVIRGEVSVETCRKSRYKVRNVRNYSKINICR
jgi:hypothetical protein